MGNRTKDICEQLERYGGGVFCDELLDVLEAIAEINDDLWHDRDAITQIERAKVLLDVLSGKLLDCK